VAAGALANLVLLDTGGVTRVTEEAFRSRSVNSWLLGRTLRGRVTMTIAAGAVVHQ
jgi:dihydroorotase-like cyclic amidohydrolase